MANYRPAPGDFPQWRADHAQFNPTTLPLVQSRTHILAYALAGLQRQVREVLHTLVGFRMPATYDTLHALLVGAGKTYPKAQGLDMALAELEDHGLIGWDREANRYDAHPIVRGVVWQLTDATDQQAVYNALAAHFEPMAVPDWLNVEALADLTPAIERYHTLVGLGRYDEAFVLFRDRLGDATFYRLAAHRERIVWLEGLFPDGVEKLPALADAGAQADALSALAQSYEFSGQPGRAMPLYRRHNEIVEHQRDKRNQRIGLVNLGGNIRCFLHHRFFGVIDPPITCQYRQFTAQTSTFRRPGDGESVLCKNYRMLPSRSGAARQRDLSPGCRRLAAGPGVGP